MSGSSPIKDVLQTLSRHAEVIEQALGGVVTAADGIPAQSIVALRQVTALRPVGEEGYRLASPLREFVTGALQIFPAMQSLADIGAKTSTISNLWDSMLDAHDDRESLDSFELEMRTTVLDIGENMDRNMLLLQTLMSTRYGNVRSLAAKRSQNSWYGKRARELAGDLARLGRVGETVEKEANGRGFDDLAAFLRRYLIARLTPWTQGLTEIQTFLRSEIYRLREIERDLKHLARTDMLLRHMPAWRGFEVALPEEIPAFLLAAKLPAVSAHVEPLDSDADMAKEMQALAKALPPKAKRQAPEEPPKRFKLVVEKAEPPPPTPAIRALGRLTKDVQSAGQGISLIDWRRGDPDACSVPASIWLLMAMTVMQANKHEVRLTLNPSREGERFAHTFRDAHVFRRAPAASSSRRAT